MCGLLNKINYEAQAAILLQKHAENFNKKGFKNPEYKVVWKGDELDYELMAERVKRPK